MTSHSVADARTFAKQDARVSETSACYLGYAAVYSHGSLEYAVIAPTEESLQAAWERQPMAPELDHGEVQRVAIFSVADIDAIGSGGAAVHDDSGRVATGLPGTPGATIDEVFTDAVIDKMREIVDDGDALDASKANEIHETGGEK